MWHKQIHAVLPIDFTPTPVETMRDLINRIVTTGPTITAGIVEETSYTTHKGNSRGIVSVLNPQPPHHPSLPLTDHFNSILVKFF